jgi:hypothetical protein
MDILSGREIIFEIKAAGSYAQVCAVDCATGIEVSIVTPVGAARSDQQGLALRKLAKALVAEGVIQIDKAPTEKGDGPLATPPSSKRGFLA